MEEELVLENNKWYSAIDADEVVVGSKVIAGDSVDEIKIKLRTPETTFTNVIAIKGEDESSRFACQDGISYDLVYVLEMANREGAWTDGNFPIELVGNFVKYKDETITSKFVVTGWKINHLGASVCVANQWMSYDDLYELYVQMDGSPCGYVAPDPESSSTVLEPVVEEIDSIGANPNDIVNTEGDAYD